MIEYRQTLPSTRSPQQLEANDGSRVVDGKGIRGGIRLVIAFGSEDVACETQYGYHNSDENDTPPSISLVDGVGRRYPLIVMN